MNTLLGFALLLTSATQDGDRESTPVLRPALGGEVVVQVASTSPLRLDVVAADATALQVLRKVASAARRQLTLDPGEAELLAGRPVEAHLRGRPLQDVVSWIAGSVGLVPRFERRAIHLSADVAGSDAPALLRRALDQYRLAVLRHPDHNEAPRLRYQIANLHLALDEPELAVEEYELIEERYPRFGATPTVLLRAGHAYARLGHEESARERWFTIEQKFPDHPLVAPGYLEVVRSFRRQARLDPARRDVLLEKARLSLRRVVDHLHLDLSPQVLVDAAELLIEGGDHDRASEVLELALRQQPRPAVRERLLHDLALAYAGVGNWSAVVETARRSLEETPRGEHAAELQFLVARAHLEFDDPLTALLAVRQARQLEPEPGLADSCDLLEGRLWADVSLLDRALDLLLRAANSLEPDVAVEALLLHSELAVKDGRFEEAHDSLLRLRAHPGQELEAGVRLAELALDQRNRTRALSLAEDLLPRVTRHEDRQRLLDVVSRSLDAAAPERLSPLPSEKSDDP